jgi:sterol desaturase/sphingolipid hydroxylase (fatty acid hydroxylase superfamily)
MQKGNKFTFGDQVWDNMFWSLISSLTIWTAYECGLLWLWSQGAIPKWSWDHGAIWFIALFILIPFWDSLHFYVVHRILHWKWMYKYVHSVHHRNINVGPWSGMSMHPIEGAIYLSVILIHLILPSHPLHIAFHISWYALGPAATHCGFEAVSVAGGKYPRLGDFFHQLHHRFFECNYGNSDVPLDQLSNTFHDGTKAGTRKMLERMKLQRKVRE